MKNFLIASTTYLSLMLMGIYLLNSSKTDLEDAQTIEPKKILHLVVPEGEEQNVPLPKKDINIVSINVSESEVLLKDSEQSHQASMDLLKLYDNNVSESEIFLNDFEQLYPKQYRVSMDLLELYGEHVDIEDINQLKDFIYDISGYRLFKLLTKIQFLTEDQDVNNEVYSSIMTYLEENAYTPEMLILNQKEITEYIKLAEKKVIIP